ncbi:MAG: CidA/LrgA family protein [Clostridiales bacterium]|nr:CidA/LrgA family protein [Clostridiales bacterium]MDY3747193.1 CidA/LrgA family protein [Lachnospiraceae bacterium]
MKLLFQFGIIAIFTFIGEILNYIIPLPIPASIYGLVLLFAALCMKIIKLEQVENAADFFLAIMPIMFVPPTVNLMTVWPVLKNNLLGLLIACIISTIIVMGLTGRIAQALINYQDKKEEKFAGSVNEQTISEEVHDYE